MSVSLKALACAVPSQKFTLAEYAPDLVDRKSAEQIARVSGFRSLRIAPEEMTTSDLCVSPAMRILDDFGRGDVGAVVFVSKTPDYVSPATSHILQARLGLSPNVSCLDINEGCSGFIAGLYVSLLIAGKIRAPVLLCGGDTNSKLTSPSDRGTRCIFGDAGFAAVISHDDSGEITFSSMNYGEKSGAVIMENSRHRIVDAPKNDGYYFMDGAQVMNFALTEVTRTIADFMKYLNLKNEDVDLFACHQANKLMLNTIAKKSIVASNDFYAAAVAGITFRTTMASVMPIDLFAEYRYPIVGQTDIQPQGFRVGIIAPVVTIRSRTVTQIIRFVLQIFTKPYIVPNRYQIISFIGIIALIRIRARTLISIRDLFLRILL